MHLSRGPLGLVLISLCLGCVEPQAIDGTGNNPNDSQIGAAGATLLRLMANDYADGDSAMAGPDRPGARAISNAVAAQTGSFPNARHASDFVWQWGQFLDHDLDLTEGADPAEPAHIPVPLGDPDFDPFFTGTAQIPFHRSTYYTEGGSPVHPRQQTNGITSWIDASNVYGSDPVRQAALRANDGSGRLLTSAGNLLPFNVAGLPNAGGPAPTLFLAGDVRANEQVGLTAMHTLFVREHNTLADLIRGAFPELTGDQVYETARAIVAAEMQVITYEEFLPALLGHHALPPYSGYDPDVDATIANIFSTACYRFGHSMLSPQLMRLDRRWRPIAEGHLPLREAFFAPHRLSATGIEPILRGLAAQLAQDVDLRVVDDVRNFLFGPPGSGGFDLAALNIQRGRDHGLPSYSAVRAALGLPVPGSFAEVSSDPEVAERLASVYADVDEIDVWVGGLAEDHVHGALVGELVHHVLAEQFAALRDGDRFFYESRFEGGALRALRRVRLSQVIRRNTSIGNELPADVFRVRKPRR